MCCLTQPVRKQPKLNHQDGCAEQSAQLRYDMANILSVMNLRLYVIKRDKALKRDEAEIFEHSLRQLSVLLDHWNKLEKPKSPSRTELAQDLKVTTAR